jgi:hypothetical protein
VFEGDGALGFPRCCNGAATTPAKALAFLPAHFCALIVTPPWNVLLLSFLFISGLFI